MFVKADKTNNSLSLFKTGSNGKINPKDFRTIEKVLNILEVGVGQRENGNHYHKKRHKNPKTNNSRS